MAADLAVSMGAVSMGAVSTAAAFTVGFTAVGSACWDGPITPMAGIIIIHTTATAMTPASLPSRRAGTIAPIRRVITRT